ncbi:MAG: hypothetical protein EXS50_01090 [Candidatus Taylorbacteria bacterium]|nr:hypothetical protein [Candidatus Taylorbacteria bacterium]
MKDIISYIFKKEFKIPHEEKLRSAITRFSATEKVIFTVLFIILTLSTVSLLWHINKLFLVEVPAEGGSLSEGIIGSPRFINPVIALGDAERSLTSLVYSGLLKAAPNGTLVPDLAKNYTVSDDGLVYTFTLKDELTFHDGTPVTTDDIEFTIARIEDSAIKSPKRANWDGVTLEKLNSKQIKFTLKKPYSPFIENTTVGILPKHIWKNVSADEFAFSEFNIEPIGSGPYKVTSIVRNSGGLIQSYDLIPFSKYALNKAYISHLYIKFYSSEKDLIVAYKNGDIESLNGIAPEEAKILKANGARIETTPLPRVFAVFFNQNNVPVFADQAVREALNSVVPRKKIVNEVLADFGTEINGPIPPGSISENTTNNNVSLETEEMTTKALKILANDGWTKDDKGILSKKVKKETLYLTFSLATSNAPELKKTAEILKKTWEKLGASVTIKIFDTGDLNQNIIRPRKYDALLFGEIIGRDLDLFAFWHSSQRNDPGLNIAMYVNSKADKILDEARSITDFNTRISKYHQFENIIKQETPAIFLYSPDFIYIIPEDIKGFSVGQITTPGDRFINVNKWYRNTDEVWKIFNN